MSRKIGHEKNWIKRKQLEVQFLKSFSWQLTHAGANLPKIAQLKQTAIKKMRSSQAQQISESSFEDMRTIHNINSFQLLYTYQRINLCHYNFHLDQPYFHLKYDRKSTIGFLSYTTSGQSAISLAMLCFQDSFGPLSIFSGNPLYYETAEFFKHFKMPIESSAIEFKKSKNKKILYIDSSGNDSNLNLHELKPDIVVVDTTCWSLGSIRNQNIIDQFLDRQTDVLLLRSHIKLDCLGTEFNRLGSLLFLSKKKQAKKICSQLVKSYNHFANYFSGRAEASRLYPFLKDKAFQQINEDWIRRHIQCNQSFMNQTKTLFQNRKIQVVAFDHGLFFWLQFRNRSSEFVNLLSKKLVRILNKNGIPALTIASFPWDFVAIVVFNQESEKKSIPTIRISIPDIHPSGFEKLKKSFNKWLKTMDSL